MALKFAFDMIGKSRVALPQPESSPRVRNRFTAAWVRRLGWPGLSAAFLQECLTMFEHLGLVDGFVLVAWHDLHPRSETPPP